MKHGIVRRIQCFKFSQERSAYVTHTLYAHRKRSSLIVQEIEMINPTEHTLDLDLQPAKPITKIETKLLNQQDLQFDFSKDLFLMTTNQISYRPHHAILCVIISTKTPANIHIRPGR